MGDMPTQVHNRYELIGDRIRATRKERGYSQEGLINELQTFGYRTPSRNTLSKAEGGDPEAISGLSVGTVIGMSTLFGVDPGYFFGERDYYNHEVDLIHEKTGLSDGAIFKLADMNDDKLRSILSECIESSNLEFFLSIIGGMVKESMREDCNDAGFVSLDIEGNDMRISYARLLDWFFTEHIREEVRTISSNLAKRD